MHVSGSCIWCPSIQLIHDDDDDNDDDDDDDDDDPVPAVQCIRLAAVFAFPIQ